MPGRRIAIGDIHGCSKTLHYLLEIMIRPAKADTLFFMGDYIDRGNSSKEVIDFILGLRSEGISVRCLKGNHEEMFLNATTKKDSLENWKENGGDKTLLSFGIVHPSQIDRTYLDFFNELEYFIELDDYYLVHAGFDFSNKSPFEDTHSMLWIRNASYSANELKGKKVIHGHTPESITNIIESVRKTEQLNIGIDGGCAYINREGMGHLVAFDLDTRQLIYTPNKRDIG